MIKIIFLLANLWKVNHCLLASGGTPGSSKKEKKKNNVRDEDEKLERVVLVDVFLSNSTG